MQKNRAGATPTLPTIMYCSHQSLFVFSSCICWGCFWFCCNIKFFSFSAITISTKWRITSLRFKTLAPFPPLRKRLAFSSERLLLYYNNLQQKTSEHQRNFKLFSLNTHKYISYFPLFQLLLSTLYQQNVENY